MGTMQLLAQQLEFSYPDTPVFTGVDLSVTTGDRLAIVGENGCGKSTLLSVLAGHLDPGQGTITRHGSVTWISQEFTAGDDTLGDLIDAALADINELAAHLEQEAEQFNHDTGNLTQLTELLNHLDYLAPWQAEQRITTALSRLNAPTDRDRKLAHMSVGQRYRARLAVHLAARADFLLLDEPTNHLDAQGITFLTHVLTHWRGGIIFVTHDRRLLDDVATAIYDMDPTMDGTPVLYGQPGYLSFRFAKNEYRRRWRSLYVAQTKRLARLEHQLDRSYEGLSDEWRPPKGSQKNRRATRARTHVKAADRLVESGKANALPIPPPPPQLNFPDLPALNPSWHADEPIIDLRNPRIGRDTVRLDLPGQRITIPPSGRLLITGANAAGKSTLLAALAGQLPLERGYRSMLPDARAGVVLQESPQRVGASGASDPTGFDAAARVGLDLLESGRLDPDNIMPVAYLGLLTDEELDTPLSQLSTGQRRRFDLACALLAKPHILILDEPTNHLSVDLVDELTQHVLKTAAAVVIASHDRAMQTDLSTWPALHLGQ
ncbi:ABC-F family ATP-binding cassette domain-containing protein [Jonesia quinghaiensis]|uniref:ABC-F family ATP-binding cassette domain-containing protein n=1 Tax=Jonesia quinghaiensis TaxID=262806 RepID=UPI00048D49E4|nr:ATP-binding cassette domain-containing protein [Jonesia quinghaiensis]